MIFRLRARVERLHKALHAFMGSEASAAFARYGRPYESAGEFRERWPEIDPEGFQRWKDGREAVDGRLVGA